MSQQLNTTIAMIGVDIGKNSFHVDVRLDAASGIPRGTARCRSSASSGHDTSFSNLCRRANLMFAVIYLSPRRCAKG